MALYDLKSLVDVLLHVLMINKVFLELFGELRGECLDILDLLGDLAPDLDHLFIDVSTEEVRSLSRIMGCILNVLDQLLHRFVTQVLHTCHLHHHVLY